MAGNPINPQNGKPYPMRGASVRAQKRLDRVQVWRPKPIVEFDDIDRTILELQRELLESDEDPPGR